MARIPAAVLPNTPEAGITGPPMGNSMAVIDVRREHAMSREQALAAADRLARELARDYDLHFDWQGDMLRFKRMGAKGWLKVEDAAIAIHLELGLLLRPFKGRIEQEVTRNMDSFVAGNY